MLKHPGARRLEQLRASFDHERQVAYDVVMRDNYGGGSEGTPEAADLVRLQATESSRKSEYAALLARLRAEDPAAIREWALGHTAALERVVATGKPLEAAFATRYLAEWKELVAGKRDSVEALSVGDYAATLLAAATTKEP
jgi:hypothetical protein